MQDKKPLQRFFQQRVFTPLVTAVGKPYVESRLPDPPVIIGGCGRSGTSLLLSILAAHPQIFSLPEETGMLSYWREVPAAPDSALGAPRSYRAERLDRLYRYALCQRIPRSARRWCEKSPANVRFLEQILAHFGDQVRFIHIVRDGRDVLTSRHPQSPDRYWVSLRRWVDDVRGGLRFRDDPRVLTLRYEDLVDDHEQSLEQLCRFLGIELVDAMRNWYETTPVRKNRAWFGPLQQLHRDALRKWEQEEHRPRLQEIMADAEVVALLQELGYLPAA